MNYYERHLGDYAKDTGHLSILEHGVYTLLLDRYYGTEKPIPADLVYRYARAKSDEEKQAVDFVLEEFFTLVDNAWINKRADEEIAKFIATKSLTGGKKDNDKERQRRTRERRKELFEALRNHGVVMPWNVGIEELQAELSRVLSQSKTMESRTCHAPVTCDNTATQTPDTIHQSPCVDIINIHTTPLNTRGLNTPGEVCVFLTGLGVAHVNPSHPDLLSALGGGATQDDFAYAATEALRKHKGFSYMLKIVHGCLEKRKNTNNQPSRQAINANFDSKDYGESIINLPGYAQ